MLVTAKEQSPKPQPCLRVLCDGSRRGGGGLVLASRLLSLGLCPFLYWLVRRRCLRRLKIMKQPFPALWEQILQSHVAFFRALPDPEKERFRQLVKVFLDEVRITGIRTQLDDIVRVLVAASAVIPIFGFHDWEYHGLGEVLVYPDSFGEDYQPAGKADKQLIGMVGLKQPPRVMILSKPSLLAGFDTSRRAKDNVGIHEFAHLVEQEEIEHGLPPEVPWQAVKHWVQYVNGNSPILPGIVPTSTVTHTRTNTNSSRCWRSISSSRRTCSEKRTLNCTRCSGRCSIRTPASLMKLTFSRRPRYGRNAPCPCGSGKKYKHCCLLKAVETTTANAIDIQSSALAEKKEN